jgi:hypothetical protein
MPGQNEPKNEPVRVELPLPIEGKTPERRIKETERIHLPVHDDRGPASTQFFRPSNPADISPDTSMPDSVPLELRKDTVRISEVPPAQIKNVEPFVPPSDTVPQTPVIAVESGNKNSMLLMWILLGVSVLILIIQIWTYLS